MQQNKTDEIQIKRDKEIYVVGKMIEIYCNKSHKNPKGKLCDECSELLEYSKLRSQKCPFIENKTFCSNCRVHCYKPDMRNKIKEVMKFSGPRMLFVHPIMTINHGICTIKEKQKLKQK